MFYNYYDFGEIIAQLKTYMKLSFSITFATIFSIFILYVVAQNPLSRDTFRQRYHAPTFLEQPNITAKQVEKYILQHIKIGTPKAQVRSWLKSQYVEFNDIGLSRGSSLLEVRGIQVLFDENGNFTGTCVPTMSANTCVAT